MDPSPWFSTEQQIIGVLAGVIFTAAVAFLGNRVPKWVASYRHWHSDRAVLLADHARAKSDLAEVVRQRDELRAQLATAHQGSDINRDLISGLQQQINELKADFTERINDAIKYIVDLTVHIRDGSNGPAPEPPDSISDEVRTEIAQRIEHRESPHADR